MNSNWNRYEINRVVWNVPPRYSDLNIIGTGAASFVCSAYDSKNKIRVVIKKLSQPFAGEEQAKRVFREITLLKHVKHYNIIGLLDLFTDADSFENFKDLYLVTDRMETDLNNYLRRERLDEVAIKYFAYQMFRALKYLHSAKIMHRDLKPANLTINEDWELRIIDFGLSRTEREDLMTEYIVSRWYRAPELLMTMRSYTTAIDIWSVGCIIYEMYTNRALFPGRNRNNKPDHKSSEQLDLILHIAGFPKENFLAKLNESTCEYLRGLPIKHERVNFTEHFGKSIPNQQAIDLLDKIFRIDPEERITSEQALEHPYFERFHDPEDEPNGELLNDDFENQPFTADEWKRKVYDSICNFKPSEFVGDMDVDNNE